MVRFDFGESIVRPGMSVPGGSPPTEPASPGKADPGGVPTHLGRVPSGLHGRGSHDAVPHVKMLAKDRLRASSKVLAKTWAMLAIIYATLDAWLRVLVRA